MSAVWLSRIAVSGAAIILLVSLQSHEAAGQNTAECGDLLNRLERQRRINRAFGCRLVSGVWRLTRERRRRLVSMCRRGRDQRIRQVLADRAIGVEMCLARRASAYEKLAEERRRSGERVRDLLERSPVARRLKSAKPGPAPASVMQESIAPELTWSFAGPIDGKFCVQWNEPSDPHNWDDNYLCSERDLKFQWSFRGAITGRGLNCTQVKEAADPHTWHDNFFCWPRNLGIEFRFSSSGRLYGYRCVAIIEPSDPHTWYDNYLCHRPARQRAESE